MPTLLQNAAYIPEDDTYIVSCHTHDFVCHTFGDGKEICLDGGKSYARRAGDIYTLSEQKRYVELCLTDEDTFEHIANNLLWGTRGKDGTTVMRFRPIKEFDLEHLVDLLGYLGELDGKELYKEVVKYWIKQKASE
jgi:hypothetical protein